MRNSKLASFGRLALLARLIGGALLGASISDKKTEAAPVGEDNPSDTIKVEMHENFMEDTASYSLDMMTFPKQDAVARVKTDTLTLKFQ